MVDIRGFNLFIGTSASPELLAISIIAVLFLPNAPQAEFCCSPKGPVTLIKLILPWLDSTKVSSVPSPPSAIGTNRFVEFAITFSIPFIIEFPTSVADKLPLKA